MSWQTILVKYHVLFFQKLGKMYQNFSSAAVVICALRVNEVTGTKHLPDKLALSQENMSSGLSPRSCSNQTAQLQRLAEC